MRFFILLIPFCVLLAACGAIAQESYTLTGTVKDGASGEELIGASVYVLRLRQGVATDVEGNYALTLPADTFTIRFTYVGYLPALRQVRISHNQSLSVTLEPADVLLHEVEVKAGLTLKDKLHAPQMSVERLTSRESRLLPALFGEVDLIKTLQLKPGVKSGGEGSSGLYIRGGGPDQNLVLLDNATVYNAGHLFGFLSIFNPDAIKSVELYKGAFPAQYGGRLSSVVDVVQQEGDRQRHRISGGIGVISSRLTAEGPLSKDSSSSFLFSARRTYFDIFTRQYNRIKEKKNDPEFRPIPDYYFYDFNGKLSFTLSPKDVLTVSGYFGRDIFNFNDTNFNFQFNWGNAASTVRWTHTLQPKLISQTAYSFSNYRYRIENKFSQFNFSLGSGITDHTLRHDYDYVPSSRHHFTFGGQYTLHAFQVGRLKAGSADGRVAFNTGSSFLGSQMGLYINEIFKPRPMWELSGGLRLSGFLRQGKFYSGLEPRASMRYSINPETALKLGFARMFQYVHLASNSGASLPTDIWYPSERGVRPQGSTQVALGINRIFGRGKYLISNEVYYKWMQRQLDFRNGANLFINPNLAQDFVFGKGWSYGNEVYVEKTNGSTTGWIGYTLSWTERLFPDIQPSKFYTRYDRRHDLSVVVMHRLNKRLSLSSSFVYSSGNAFTPPVGRFVLYDIPGASPNIIPLYPERNTERMPAYHRLDLGVVLRLRPKRGESDLTFSVYNFYNRRNPYFIYFEEVRDASDRYVLRFQAKQVALFPVIPSVTYNFKF